MMKTSRILITILVFLNCLLFISCSKEEERNGLPRVEIIYPLENSVYSTGDDITVVADIVDDQLIKSIKISVKDLNNVPVYTKDISGINAISYHLQTKIRIDDAEIDGAYYIDVQAFDEKDFGSSYVYIQILGQKTYDKKFLIFTENAGSVEYYYADSTVRLKESYFGDLMESAWDQTNKTAILCGRYTGDLMAIDTSGKKKWKHSNPSIPTLPYFNDLLLHEENVFVSLEEGKILGFDNEGNRFFEEVLSSDFRITAIHRYNDRFIYIKERKIDGIKSIRQVYYPSGTVIDERTFDYGDVLSLHSVGNKIIILSYKEPVQNIVEYDPFNFNMILRQKISGVSAADNSLTFNSEDVLFSQEDNILQYNYINGGSLEKLSMLDVSCMKKDNEPRVFWYSGSTTMNLVQTTNTPWLEFEMAELSSEISGEIKSFEIFLSE